MKITQERITPEIAKKYLALNKLNRKLRQSTVDSYANEMAADRWKITGEPIQFFQNGTLANGQHRLNAVIQSGKTIEFVVIRGLSKDAMSGMDGGAKRSVADFLHLHHGLQDANLATAAARQIVSLCFSYQGYNLSADVLLRVLNHFGEEIAITSNCVRGFRPALKSWIVAGLSFALKSHPTEVSEFIHILSTGENAAKGSPALTFRNWLINNSSFHLKAVYRRGAYEALFNALHNHVHNNKLISVRSGVNGAQYFASKQRRFIEQTRQEIAHLLSR